MAALLRIPGVADVVGLFLQPPAEVLPSPSSVIVQPALGDLDVFVRFVHHNYHMIGLGIFVFHQVAGSELLPAWAGYPPPWEVPKGGVRTERGPAGAGDTAAIWPATGGAVR